MKALFFLVETSKIDCDIIYANPPFCYDSLFNCKEDDADDLLTFCKEKVQHFLSVTSYFGNVNTKNILGYNTNVMKDFLAPTKKAISHEIIIEDIFLLTQSITFQVTSTTNQISAFNLVLQLQKQDAYYVSHWKKSLTYLAKVLELDEQLRAYLSVQVNKIYEKSSEFEKRVSALPVEIEKLKLPKIEVARRLLDSIRSLAATKIQQLELYQILQNFFDANQGIKINHFGYQLPASDMLLNPVQIEIKPYQTIIIKRNLCLNILSNIKSLRFEKQLCKIIELIALSFNDMSIQYNFSLKEIQVYITHLQMHQKGTIINKLTQDSIFTLNPKYEFVFDKNLKRLADHIFERYRFDLICAITALDTPCKCSELYQEIAGFGRNCLISLIGQKVIQECDVYLYLKDPFLTPEKFKIALKERQSMEHTTSHSVSMSQLEGLMNNSRDENFTSKEEKTDIIIMRHVNKYLAQKISLNDIAWKLGADVSLMWKFLNKYNDYIGYYYIL